MTVTGNGQAKGQPAPASWLAGLVAPEKQGGRLKGRVLQILVVLALVAMGGIALMNVADMLRPRSAGSSWGSTGDAWAPGAGGTGGSGSGASGQAFGGSPGGGSSSGQPSSASGVWISVTDLEAMMERTLERILSQVEGAGKVTVAVSLEAGATYTYEDDETSVTETSQERDANGGTRTVTQTNTTRTAVVVTQGAGSQPVVVKVQLPPIKGVVVVATGARDSRVKALLAQAVQILYGVPAHRVVVLAGG